MVDWGLMKTTSKMAASRSQLLWTRLGQRLHRSFSTSQRVNNIGTTGTTGQDQRSLLRKIITNWKTPSLTFLSFIGGCLFYERFIEEPDETGKREPLITRLMVEYLMPDPEEQQQIRNDHLRKMRKRCDEYLERKRQPLYGLKPFDIEEMERHIAKAPEMGPDGF